ncbi:MAG: hypothetical protein K0R76_1281 [Alphaproteobacteria bacterium]|nr:hypothetical protein [Alphaproteobacteria bacterium]
MNRKTLSLLTGIAAQMMMQGGAYASENPSPFLTRSTAVDRINCNTGTSQTTPTPINSMMTSSASATRPQFYVGLSSGFENLSGRRSEELIADPIFAQSTIFSNNQKFSSRADIALSAIAGFQWGIPNLPLSIGPEIYLGKGNGSNLVKINYHDAIAAENRTYAAEFKRKLFYGFIVRTGWNFWKDYFGFLSLGIDMSHFMTDRSMLTNTNLPNFNFQTLRRTKKLSGFLMGIGIEKRFGCIGVGIDLKRVTYRQQNFFDTLNPDPGTPPNQLSFSVRPKIYSLSLRISYLF